MAEDVEREKFSLWVLLAIAASTLVQTAILEIKHIDLASIPSMFHVVLIFSIFLTLGSSLIAAAMNIGGKRPRFFFRDPTASASLEISQDGSQWIRDAVDRLKRLGFAISSQESGEWKIEKGKGKRVHSFLGHRFEGSLRVIQGKDRDKLEINLTLKDFIILETNETGSLVYLAEYLLGTRAEYLPKTLPLTLVCSITLLLATHLLTYVNIINRDLEIPLVQGYLGAFGFSVWMFFAILKNRGELLGLRLSVLAGLVSMGPLLQQYLAKGSV